MTRWQDRAKARARRRRRGFPIRAYVGPNGSGKSMVMVYDTIPSLRAGRPVLSTVRLLDFDNPRPCPGGSFCDDPDGHFVVRRRVELGSDPASDARLRFLEEPTGEVHAACHPYYVRFTDYAQLLNWRDGDILMDEVTGVASSREIANMPVQVANFLVQLRRRNIVLSWSTPSWGRADKIIREVTQLVTLSAGRMSVRRSEGGGAAARLWYDSRLFFVRSFDPSSMEEFEAHRADRIPAEISAWYWRPGALVGSAYNTDDGVSSLGWANDAGMCMHCGGKRQLSRCACTSSARSLPPVTAGFELVRAIGGGEAGSPEGEASASDSPSLSLAGV